LRNNYYVRLVGKKQINRTEEFKNWANKMKEVFTLWKQWDSYPPRISVLLHSI